MLGIQVLSLAGGRGGRGVQGGREGDWILCAVPQGTGWGKIKFKAKRQPLSWVDLKDPPDKCSQKDYRSLPGASFSQLVEKEPYLTTEWVGDRDGRRNCL